MNTSAFVFPQDQPDGPAGKARAGGLTLRQYYAGKALSALPIGVRDYTSVTAEQWASMAWELAEAMVALENEG